MDDPRFRDSRPRQRRPEVPAAEGERLEKVLAAHGVASRRDCEQMIRQARIRVNGETVRQLPYLVKPGRDLIEVDDEEIDTGTTAAGPATRIYIALNKPKEC